MVTFQFEQPQSQSDFRGLLEEKFDTGITIERLTTEGESQQAEAGVRWRLRTVNDNTREVQAGIAEALGGLKLKKVSMSASEVTSIADEDTGDAEAADAKPKSAFAGGLQSTLTFESENSSSEISLVTVVENLKEAIEALPDAASRYPEPAALYRLTGTAGQGVTAEEGQVQTFSEVLLEARPDGLPQADLEAVLTAVEQKMDRTPLFEEVTTFSESVGGEMQQQAILAMALSLAAIIIYIWLRFQRVTFGFAAVVARSMTLLLSFSGRSLACRSKGPNWLFACLQRLQNQPADDRSLPDHRRVLVERRSSSSTDSRSARQEPRADDGYDQHQPESDAVANPADLADYVHRGGDSVRLRRRGNSRIRVLSAGRSAHRNVQLDLRCQPGSAVADESG